MIEYIKIYNKFENIKIPLDINKKIELKSSDTDFIDRMNNHLQTSGILITSITGIGPVKASINIAQYASNDGGVYKSSRTSERNIVISFKLYGTNIELTRDLIYRFLQVKSKIKFAIKTDYRDVIIDGYVESCEPNIFSKEEDIQVSILCPSPYFIGDKIVRTTNDNAQKIFKFPFMNPSLIEDEILFGMNNNDDTFRINYDGDIPSGIKMTILLGNKSLKNLTIYINDGLEYITIEPSGLSKIDNSLGNKFIPNDIIFLDTNKGSKSASLLRNNKTYNIISLLPKFPKWINLVHGNNILYILEDDEPVDIYYEVESYNLYSGV